MRVLVAGGSGCVGRPLCAALADRGHRVTAGSRSTADPWDRDRIEPVRLDVTDPPLEAVVAGHDAVVNLVALPSHVQPAGATHDAVSAGGTWHLVRAAEATGVDRFVQLSAVGVESDVSTAYLDAKRAAERTVRESGLEWVIVRPSIVFGDGCAFLPFLRRLAAARVVPLPDSGDLPVQPIWSGDLAGLLADVVEADAHVGCTYEVGGPERVSLADLLALVRPGAIVVPLPGRLAAAGAALADVLPGVPLGRDQYRAFALDATVPHDDLAAFGLEPADLRTVGDHLGGERSSAPSE